MPRNSRWVDSLEARRHLAAGQLDPAFGVRGQVVINDSSIYRDDVTLIGTGPNDSLLFRLVRRVDEGDGIFDQPILKMLDRAGMPLDSFSGDGELPLDGQTNQVHANQISIDPSTGMIAIFESFVAAGEFTPRVRFISPLGVENAPLALAALAYSDGDTVTHALAWHNGELYLALGRFDQFGESNEITFYRIKSDQTLDFSFGGGAIVFTPEQYAVRVSEIVPLGDGDVMLVLSNFADAGPILPGYHAMRFDHNGAREASSDVVYTTIDLTDQINAMFRASGLNGIAALVQVQGDGFFNERVDLYDSAGTLVQTIAPDFLGGNDRTEDALDFHADFEGRVTFVLRRLIDGTKRITRFDSTGAVDERFGVFGSVTLDPMGEPKANVDGSVVVHKLESPKSGGFRQIEVSRYQGGAGRTATPGTIEVDGTKVTFNGTSEDDLIRLMRRGSDGRLVVRINSLIKSFDSKRAKQLKIYGFDGADEVIVGEAVLGTQIFGGRGNDTITGGTGDDRIFGGPHDDLLLGDRGNDQLRGEGGNDSLNGGRGYDTLWGEDGNDSLNGAGNNDVLLGGQRVFDLIIGGSGIDSATSDPLDEYRQVESFRSA